MHLYSTVFGAGPGKYDLIMKKVKKSESSPNYTMKGYVWSENS